MASVIGFLTIGGIWVSHQQTFTVIARVTPTFLYLNVLFLLPAAMVSAGALLPRRVGARPEAHWRAAAAVRESGTAAASAAHPGRCW